MGLLFGIVGFAFASHSRGIIELGLLLLIATVLAPTSGQGRIGGRDRRRASVEVGVEDVAELVVGEILVIQIPPKTRAVRKPPKPRQTAALAPAGLGAAADRLEAAFREAEELQKQRQPEFPLLYSVPGFRYCDLLLS